MLLSRSSLDVDTATSRWGTHAFAYESSDIPAGMTVRDFRTARPTPRPRTLLRRLGGFPAAQA